MSASNEVVDTDSGPTRPAAAMSNLDLAVSSASRPDDLQALITTTAAMRQLIRQTSDAIERIDSIRDAIVMVRRSGAVEKLVGDALRAYKVMNEEQFELRQQAAEVHLRTQRRAGELLRELTKHTGGRPSQTGSTMGQVSSQPSTLSELRINRHDSHRWQRLAAIPMEMFNHYIQESHKRRRELTTSSMLAVAKRHHDDKIHFGDADARPSSKPALLLEYDRVKRELLNAIWLDPLAISSAMDRHRCQREIEDLKRFRLWLDEFEDALKAHPTQYRLHLRVASS